MTENCKAITADELAALDLFKEDSREALEWLAERFEVRCMEAGEQFAKSGQPAREFMVLLEGELQYKDDNDRYGGAFVMLPGTAGGVLPFSRPTLYRGRGGAGKRAGATSLDSSY